MSVIEIHLKLAKKRVKVKRNIATTKMSENVPYFPLLLVLFSPFLKEFSICHLTLFAFFTKKMPKIPIDRN